jgi:uncharacterized membrane protein YagU involved in acid resistance
MKLSIGRTIAGGFVGTFLMTLLMRYVAPTMGVRMNIAASLAKMMHTSVLIGLVVHFVLGTIVFAVLYAYILYRILPGPPVVRGAAWGIILWIMMELLVMPMLGMGVFNSAMGGLKTGMAALIAHVVYGAFLGWIAGTAPDRVATATISIRTA